jgi:peptidoglycan/xylan/chitin deacetylase (PgdA/CDA1 family)
MIDAGLSVGAHTYSHRPLAALKDAEALSEMRDCRVELEDRLGRSIRSIAYPYGRPGKYIVGRTLELAHEAGFEFGATTLQRTVRPNDNVLAIPRFIAEGRSISILASRVAGTWDIFGLLQERATGWHKIGTPKMPDPRVEPCG